MLGNFLNINEFQYNIINFLINKLKKLKLNNYCIK